MSEQDDRTSQRAVVDRMEGDLAVVLVGDGEDEHHLSVRDLPEGAGEGARLVVRIDGGEVVVLEVLDAEGEDEDLAHRLGRLRRRRPSDRLRPGGHDAPDDVDGGGRA